MCIFYDIICNGCSGNEKIKINSCESQICEYFDYPKILIKNKYKCKECIYNKDETSCIIG